MRTARLLTIAVAATGATAVTASAVAARPLDATTAGADHVTNVIVPFQSIGGAAIGATPAAVRRAIGPPDQVRHVRGQIGQFFYENEFLSVDFQPPLHGSGTVRVSDVMTGLSRYRTRQGLHVGSGVDAVRRVYRHSHCAAGDCTVTRGDRVTDFEIDGGKVASILVSVR